MSVPPPPPPSPPVPPPVPPPVQPAAAPSLDPTALREREPILDVLRGFALLGILLVNIELMRGPDVVPLFFGFLPEVTTSAADDVVGSLIAWLAAGKFVSSFALLFGVGAALIVGRARQRGRAPRGLLARRYGLLLGLGLLHMVLLFPGDILFVYGVTGMVLLAFVDVQPRTATRWAIGLIGLAAVLTVALTALPGGPVPLEDGGTLAELAVELQQRTLEAYTSGGYGSIVLVNAVQAALVQAGQLTLLPWFLGMFLLGFALGRSGVVQDLRSYRPQLRRAALLGLAIGLPLNLPGVALGILGTGAEGTSRWLLALGGLTTTVGAPVLAIGYLATVALLCLRFGPLPLLGPVGRMALTAYLLQSVLALVAFAGFGLYGELGIAASLWVVLGIWVAVVAVANLWMRSFAFGPVEWAWRSLTYGRRQPLRRTAQGS
jgi:uncharacterized protein